MKIVLATGIYPPDIGGPATYVRHLAEELSGRGHQVTVITYALNPHITPSGGGEQWNVVRVSKKGGPLLRWIRYAKALKEYGSDADVVECFSSVSCGVPLRLARLKKPRKVLRLGGDFLWERYTDLGRRRTLREFLIRHPRFRFPMARLLATFDHIIFSTRFQQLLYERAYRGMPRNSVIENVLSGKASPVPHQKHDPVRLLFLGRFVRFKNLDRLFRAVSRIPLATLTLVGEGPQKEKLLALSRTLQLQGRVSIVPPVHGEEVQRVFADHDLFVLPSLTEISPNAALEARAAGLPVLLSEENGLSEALREGMIIRPLISTTDITKAILEADHRYDEFAQAAAAPFVHGRGWDQVADEHLALFQSFNA